MLWISISYLMMFVSGFGLGMGAVKALAYLCGWKDKEARLTHYLITGFILLTVYAQIVSLFTAVTYIFAFVALTASIAILLAFHKSLWEDIQGIMKEIVWYEWILFLIFTVFVMFLTSLYPKQYDNYLYQAQMLRYYEEYGVIKGMGNISTRLGFNNSIYALMALYSFKGIYGFSLHTVNSAFCVFFGNFAIHNICRIRKTKAYVSTGLAAAVLAYVFYNSELLNCIGTDLSANMIGLMIMLLFAQEIEKREKDTFIYGLISLYIVYAVTVKVSVGMLGILIFYPAFLMIKKKEWKRIFIFIPAGLLILVPWLIRNVMISGWLIYPLPSLDLFDVKWKIPYKSVVYETALIKGWARIQTSKVFETMEMTFSRWFPIWFRGLLLRYRLLLYLNGFCVVYEVAEILYCICKREIGVLDWLLLKGTALAGILYWMLSAPDVRLAWGFLAAFPVICIFSSKVWGKIVMTSRFKGQLGNYIFVGMIFCVCCYSFMKADCVGVFKTSIAGRINSKAFYIYQGDFSELPVEEYIINGDVFYWSPAGDQAGYYGFPGTTDKALLDNLGYLEEDFEDGVYYKGGQSW